MCMTWLHSQRRATVASAQVKKAIHPTVCDSTVMVRSDDELRLDPKIKGGGPIRLQQKVHVKRREEKRGGVFGMSDLRSIARSNYFSDYWFSH